MWSIIFSSFLFILNLSISHSWNLGLNSSEYQVIHVSGNKVIDFLQKLQVIFNSFNLSVYYARAFICLRHQKNSLLPTLIESSWPENIIGVKPTIFPSEETHLRRSKKCKGIKQAISTDIDSTGRLWALDEGIYKFI